jgi:hypothetical protein
MTERAPASFAVKEFVDGVPWIVCEIGRKPFAGVPDGLIGFDLPPGTTFEEAQEIQRYLETHLTNVTFTPLND